MNSLFLSFLGQGLSSIVPLEHCEYVIQRGE